MQRHSSPSAHALHLQTQLVTLVQHATVLETSLHEDWSLDDFLAQIIPEILRCHDGAQGVLAELLDPHEEEAGEEATALANMAYMAEIELREKLRHVKSAAAQDPPSRSLVFSLAGASCSKIIEALTTVENALAAQEGLERRLTHAHELKKALALREALTKFRRNLQARHATEAISVRTDLRWAATAIATLLGSDAFYLLRLDERTALRDLQARIFAWVKDPQSSLPEGLRLWQDLVGFSEVQREINKRSLLEEHDRRTLQELLPLLQAQEDTALVSASLCERLGTLFGRSDELDELVLAPETAAAGDWRRALAALGTSLQLRSAANANDTLAKLPAEKVSVIPFDPDKRRRIAKQLAEGLTPKSSLSALCL